MSSIEIRGESSEESGQILDGLQASKEGAEANLYLAERLHAAGVIPQEHVLFGHSTAQIQVTENLIGQARERLAEAGTPDVPPNHNVVIARVLNEYGGGREFADDMPLQSLQVSVARGIVKGGEEAPESWRNTIAALTQEERGIVNRALNAVVKLNVPNPVASFPKTVPAYASVGDVRTESKIADDLSLNRIGPATANLLTTIFEVPQRPS